MVQRALRCGQTVGGAREAQNSYLEQTPSNCHDGIFWGTIVLTLPKAMSQEDDLLAHNLFCGHLQVDPRDRCTSEDGLRVSLTSGVVRLLMVLIMFIRSALSSNSAPGSVPPLTMSLKVDKVLLATTDIRERTINIQALSEETRDTIATCARRISGLRSLVMEVAKLTVLRSKPKFMQINLQPQCPSKSHKLIKCGSTQVTQGFLASTFKR
eukprot:1156014-Pelagomonas_calceolata.AAC.16